MSATHTHMMRSRNRHSRILLLGAFAVEHATDGVSYAHRRSHGVTHWCWHCSAIGATRPSFADTSVWGSGERWLHEPSSPRRIGRGRRTYGRLLRCRARSTQMLPSRTPGDGGGSADLARLLPPPPVRRLENGRGRKTHPALINHEVEGTNYLLHRYCRGVTVSGIPGDEEPQRRNGGVPEWSGRCANITST